MATTRIKDKISELVNSQLPEHIRTDYTTFAAFLEYYYKFLEQDQGALELVQNARQYSDIDQTTSSFVNYFLTNYAKDLPYSLTVNKPLLIKRITDLYAAKGSSLSIETLFRVLYDTAATTRHPYDFVLRPSDGKWDLRTSLRVLKTSGSVANIKDRFLTLTKNNIDYNVEIVRVKTLTTDLYEIFYKTKINVPFEIEDDVVVSGTSGTIFTGTVKPTTAGWSISKGGTGFRAGQIFNVSVNGAVDTLVRITKVSSTGAIEALKFLNYGYNYTEDLTIVLTNALGVSARTKAFDTTGGGFSETIKLIQPWTALDAGRYFDTDYTTVSNFYTGNLVVNSSVTSQLLTSATITGTEAVSSAIINFTVGAIARYPGQYTSTQGFLSEPDVRLQDGGLYQPFAYQIESELDISTFYNIVKKLVHQAGTNMYVSRTVSVTANIKPFVDVITRKNVQIQLNSVFNILDRAEVALLKDLPGETIEPTDSLTISLTKGFTDDVTATEDTFNLVQYWEAYQDNVTTSEEVTLNVTKPIIDETNVSITDSFTQVFGKNISDSDIDSVSLSESTLGILLNYTDNVGATGYFSEIYVGETVINVSRMLSGSAKFVNNYPTINQYLTTTVTAPGTDSATYEWWVRRATTLPATQGMMSTRTNTSGNDGFDVSLTSGGTITVSDAGTFLFTGGGTISNNTWYHIAVVRNGTTTWTVYKDGISVGTFNKTGTTGTDLSIGRKSATSYNEFLNGYISNFRYVKGVAVYTGNFTVPTSPLTATQSAGSNISAITSETDILLNTNYGDDFLVDSSVNNRTITNANAVVVSRFTPLS